MKMQNRQFYDSLSIGALTTIDRAFGAFIENRSSLACNTATLQKFYLRLTNYINIFKIHFGD